MLEDNQPPVAEFISKLWKVVGNVIVAVPNDSLDENSVPLLDQSPDSDHILVTISKGKFLALERSTEMRTQSEDGSLATPFE